MAPRKDLPDPMSDQLPARLAEPHEAQSALRVAAMAAVCVGVAALAGAAFVLSYTGIHDVALQAGISVRLARYYPLIFDVLLVIVLAAALSLRGAGWPSKLLAWIALLALLAAAAGADALHAAGRRLPARPAAVTAAVLPWILVLIAFVLLLAMLRHARLRKTPAEGYYGASTRVRRLAQPEVPSPVSSQPLVPGFSPRSAEPIAHVVLRPSVASKPMPNSAPDTIASFAEPDLDSASYPAEPDGELAIDTDLVEDDPASDEAAEDLAAEAYDGAPATDEPPDSASEADDDDDVDASADSDDQDEAAGTAAADQADADADVPVFHRMWSTPVAPVADEE